MTQWITQPLPEYAPVDLDVVQESALAGAQATISNAMKAAGMKPTELAKKLGWDRSAVSRIMSGRHNLTVKTFALALAGCGYKLKFEYAPLRWRWAAEPLVEADRETQSLSQPTFPVGTFMRTAFGA